MDTIPESEITPEGVYRSRRSFMRGVAALGVGAFAAACGQLPSGGTTNAQGGAQTTGAAAPVDTPTSYEAITHYNNYYEFSTSKEAVASLARTFTTSPWTVEIGGLVNKPGTFAYEDLLKRFPQEERVYRHRCVEGWSMVIPWQGFPLRSLLSLAEPNDKARFVRFQTVSRPSEMPGQHDALYAWPYTEGLRLDEAMNDLALLVTGLYGKPLPPQNGAPLRLAVPWKYGFKSVKSIVKIDLVDKAPTTLWMAASPQEYGFYANVNPDVPHPRWSQATERRISETGRRKTLPFNGYAEQVAHMYTDLDLRKNF
ncbi:MAG: protein-methionine-sulfoxide reductase catalytic subunit MsrP [Herpetosiphon sp.]